MWSESYGHVIYYLTVLELGHGLSLLNHDVSTVTTLESIISLFLFIIAHRSSRWFPFEPRRRQAKFGTRADCLSMAATGCNTIVEIEGFRTLYFGPELFYLLNAKAFESNLFTTVTQYA